VSSHKMYKIKVKKERERELKLEIDDFTCIPIIAYMKNNMAISKQTYGSALKDWTKVHSRILIVYPWRSSLMSRAARKSLRKPTLKEFSCCKLELRWMFKHTACVTGHHHHKLTPSSRTRASIILPMTVIKSKTFHGSLKKFWIGIERTD